MRTNLISAKANLMPRCNKGLVLETRQSNRPRSHCALQAADKRATLRVSSPMEWKRPRSWLQKPNQRAHLSGLAVGASLAEMGSQSWKQNQWSCNQNGSDDQRSCQGDMTGTLAHRSVKLRLVSHTPNTIHVHLCAQPRRAPQLRWKTPGRGQAVLLRAGGIRPEVAATDVQQRQVEGTRQVRTQQGHGSLCERTHLRSIKQHHTHPRLVLEGAQHP